MEYTQICTYIFYDFILKLYHSYLSIICASPNRSKYIILFKQKMRLELLNCGKIIINSNLKYKDKINYKRKS